MSLGANHEASAYGFSPGASDGDSQGFPPKNSLNP